ncbi:hypothetical protein ARALYDRAFT_898216 [Arabidopsis lyrata subsp. lyrata]|uniref:Uncharacterized protein n=1 Tax=Arabidopsis lyrata subsp. lyrata TaxID=81972 RepID=D7L8I6_ARALL|nr:hypothetical protein ARALYDRAFT_898216 [Arabidopsis lyrata subsp. lyrata]
MSSVTSSKAQLATSLPLRKLLPPSLRHISGCFLTIPFFGTVGSKTLDHGLFWKIRPLGSGLPDKSAYLTIPSIVKQAFKASDPAT